VTSSDAAAQVVTSSDAAAQGVKRSDAAKVVPSSAGPSPHWARLRGQIRVDPFDGGVRLVAPFPVVDDFREALRALQEQQPATRVRRSQTINGDVALVYATADVCAQIRDELDNDRADGPTRTASANGDQLQ
jgi:hypothetical protein